MRRTALVLPTVAVAGLALLAGCSSGGNSCLNGSWEPADMTEFGVEQIEDLGGSFDFTMKFDGGTVSINATSSIPATDYTEAMDMEVTAKGKYSVSGDKIKVTDMSGTTKINGEEQADDSGLGGLDEGETTFSCSGNKLTLDGQDFTKK